MVNKKMLIAAGGTGGHIFPALAIAKALRESGAEILYVGNRNSMEEKLAEKAGFKFAAINVQKLHRYFTFSHIKFPFKLLNSIQKSKKIITDFQPDAFVGTGGFVCGPVGYAAHKCKIPIFLQEQNSFPGLTTRKLSKYAQLVFLGNNGAAQHLNTDKYIISGNPINPSVADQTEIVDFQKLGLDPDSFKLFLFGGSQGSLILNRNFFPIVDEILKKDIEIIWQIGKYSFAEFFPKVKDRRGIYAFDFTHEMGKILNSVDLVIARAGALSLAEIETKKLPSILVPLPSAAGNHQYYNAKELADKGVAILLEQKDLNTQRLLQNVLNAKKNISDMKSRFSESLHSLATQKITDRILSELQKD